MVVHGGQKQKDKKCCVDGESEDEDDDAQHKISALVRAGNVQTNRLQ